MRYLLYFVCFLFTNVLSAQTLLEKKLDFKVEQLEISETLLLLSKLSEIPISFSGKLFDKDKLITLNLHQETCQNILKKC